MGWEEMNITERYRSYVAVFIILRKDNKVLLLQRQNTGYRDGDYDFPAGHLEEGETVVNAAIREAKEEASVDIEPSDMQFGHVMHRKTSGGDGRVYMDFFFVAKKWSGEPHIGEPNKCSSMEWFTMDKLPNNFIEYQKQALENIDQGLEFSEWGWSE